MVDLDRRRTFALALLPLAASLDARADNRILKPFGRMADGDDDWLSAGFEEDEDEEEDEDAEGLEAYLEAHARKFVGAFDANCYLYLSRAMDLFDVADHGGSL